MAVTGLQDLQRLYDLLGVKLKMTITFSYLHAALFHFARTAILLHVFAINTDLAVNGVTTLTFTTSRHSFQALARAIRAVRSGNGPHLFLWLRPIVCIIFPTKCIKAIYVFEKQIHHHMFNFEPQHNHISQNKHI